MFENEQEYVRCIERMITTVAERPDDSVRVVTGNGLNHLYMCGFIKAFEVCGFISRETEDKLVIESSKMFGVSEV